MSVVPCARCRTLTFDARWATAQNLVQWAPRMFGIDSTGPER